MPVWIFHFNNIIDFIGCVCQTNIASGKTVSLSSQYDGTSTGSNAVNGITSGLWADGCASTLKQNFPWLEIDFGSVFSISSIVLYNRIDCSICREYNCIQLIFFILTTGISNCSLIFKITVWTYFNVRN